MTSINEKLVIILSFALVSSTIFVSAGGGYGGHGGHGGGLATILAAGLITLILKDINGGQRASAPNSGYQALPAHNGLAHSGLAHNGLAHSGLAHNGLAHSGLAHNGLAHNGLGYIPEVLTLGLLSKELSQNYEAIPEVLALNQGLNYGNYGNLGQNALLSSMFARELGLLPGNIPHKYGLGLGLNNLGVNGLGMNGLGMNGLEMYGLGGNGLGHSLYGFNGNLINPGVYNQNIVPQAIKQQNKPLQNAAVSN